MSKLWSSLRFAARYCQLAPSCYLAAYREHCPNGFIAAVRTEMATPIEILSIPAPGVTACMQKIQLCSTGLMNGFGDPNHCYLPTEVTVGSLAVICHRHIDEARRLGVIENELVLS